MKWSNRVLQNFAGIWFCKTLYVAISQTNMFHRYNSVWAIYQMCVTNLYRNINRQGLISVFFSIFWSISISNWIYRWRHVIRRQTRANYASTRRAMKPRFGVGARGRAMVMREGHGLTHEKTCTDTWDKRSRRWCLRPQDRVSTVRIKRNPSPMRGKWLHHSSGLCIESPRDAYVRFFTRRFCWNSVRCINNEIWIC